MMPNKCPFCGGKAVSYGRLDMRLRKGVVGDKTRIREGYVYHVICENCDAQGPFCASSSEAIKYWNGMMSMYGHPSDIADLYGGDWWCSIAQDVDTRRFVAKLSMNPRHIGRLLGVLSMDTYTLGMNEMDETTPIGMNMFDIEQWKYQNNHFFHKGRWVTQEMVDTEAWMKRVAEIFDDPTLTRVQKLQKALGRKK